MHFLDVYVRFSKFQKVKQSCNMLQPCVERCGSLSSVCRYVLIVVSVKISYKCCETSLTVISISVSLTLSRVWLFYLHGKNQPV